jgi:hypothetical protein
MIKKILTRVVAELEDLATIAIRQPGNILRVLGWIENLEK